MAFLGARYVSEISELEGLQGSSTDSDDGNVQPAIWGKLPRGQVAKLAVAGMALMALLGTAFYCTGFSTISTITLDKELDDLVDLAEESPGNKVFAKCDDLAVIKPFKIVRNNLGGKGPDTTMDEGVIYNTLMYMKDHQGNVIAGKNVTVALHATSPYDMSTKNTFNGLHGKFLSILIRSGTQLSFNISVYDSDTNEPLTLPYFSITFFDLDMSEVKKSAEYLIAQDFKHYYVANGTQVNVTENSDGTTKFRATEPGTGDDNPKESEALNLLSKSKGVTLQYMHRQSTDFTIGAEDGNSQRGFLFTLRPSMICAKTVVGGKEEDPMDTSITGVELPLMDGTVPVTGMEAPIIKISPNGTVVVITEDGNLTIDNVADVMANKNGTVTIEEENGTEILEKGVLTEENGTDVVDTTENDKAKASPQSGTQALLIVVTLLAVVWPLGNLQ